MSRLIPKKFRMTGYSNREAETRTVTMKENTITYSREWDKKVMWSDITHI
jgi:hypothetical protein